METTPKPLACEGKIQTAEQALRKAKELWGDSARVAILLLYPDSGTPPVWAFVVSCLSNPISVQETWSGLSCLSWDDAFQNVKNGFGDKFPVDG